MWGSPLNALEPSGAPPLQRPRDHAAARRLVLVLGSALGAAALGILLQFALANPAGAATLPVPGPASAVEGGLVSPVGATVGGVGNGAAVALQATTPVVQGVASVVQSTTTTLPPSPLGPALGVVTQPVGAVDGVLGASAPSLPSTTGALTGPLSGATGAPATTGLLGMPVTVGARRATPTLVVPTAVLPAATPSSPTLLASTGTVTRVLSAAGTSLSAVALASGVTQGHHPSAPQAPGSPLFPSPAGATSDASSPAHGGSPLDALPPVSLLLPALIALGVLLGRQRNPVLVFAMRAAPPG